MESSKQSNKHPFQHYVEKYFKFPSDLKIDLVYCQRAMRAYIKVHQMVVDVFNQQVDADPAVKARMHDELEKDIEEINAEQELLFIRLRKEVGTFLKMLNKKGIKTNYEEACALVSKQITPLITDENLQLLPVAVTERFTEEQLIEKYFEVQGSQHFENKDEVKEIYEILDSDDEEVRPEYAASPPPLVIIDQPIPQKIHLIDNYKLFPSNSNPNGVNYVEAYDNETNFVEKSTWKPYPKLSTVNFGTIDLTEPPPLVPTNYRHAEQTHEATYNSLFLSSPINAKRSTASISEKITESTLCTGGEPSNQISFIDVKKDNSTKNIVISHAVIDEPPAHFPVSKNVTKSRLNLRQALKKAKNETMAAMAAAKTASPVNTPPLKPKPKTVTVPILSPSSSPPQNLISLSPPPLSPIPAAQTPSPPQSILFVSASSQPSQPNKKQRQKQPPPPPPLPPPPPIPTHLKKIEKSSKSDKYGKNEVKTKTTRSSIMPCTTTSVSKENTIDLTSSSDDSIEDISPKFGNPLEPIENRTNAEEYGKENFLRIFQLYTPAVLSQLQQRRSKRKRRKVISNERSDFHYGRFDLQYNSFLATIGEKKKKRKAFLLSPQVKLNRKRTSVEKIDDEANSRSSSSSPVEQRSCSECLKSDGIFKLCKTCKLYYHENCEQEQEQAKASTDKNISLLDGIPMCIPCKRIEIALLSKEDDTE